MRPEPRKLIVPFLLALGIVHCTDKMVMASDQNGAKSIIAEHCIECHRVPGFAEEARNPAIAAPDFQTIADDRKTYTTERLHAFLRQPHFPMRALTLSESDIQSLVNYIRGLKADSSKID